ncbi:hypothetical protein OF83DRAFT_1163613 [Amylostereum chailletii]|nr:hypothetical protein OF83DRAFT_1163613 [Amylostereum chailletii]
MAPKNKGKKGKKGKKQDDEFWEKAGESVAGNNLEVSFAAGDEADGDSAVKGGFSSFTSLAVEAPPDDDEDLGGLMSTLKASQKNKKEKKKAKKGGNDETSVPFADGPDPGQGSDGEAAAAKGDISAPKGGVEMTPDELADEEWGPVKEKKKGKKDKKKKGKADKEEEEEAAPGECATYLYPNGTHDTPASEATEATKTELAASPEDDEDGGAADGSSHKILSKKEKEKLKKEKEKAKKKAQAVAKKGQDPSVETEPTKTAESIPAPLPEKEDEEGEDGEAAGDGDAKKKKKKKKAKKEEEPAPAPTKKKGGAGISALKAMMEEKRRLEEEARRLEEEERKRIEEEERRLEEEEQRREEEKKRKKEKEKAKREVAKKEGRLLTKKQKEDQRAAELRRQALLASGVQIEGLQEKSGGPSAPKRPIYGTRKKGQQAARGASPAPTTDSTPQTPEPGPTAELAPEPDVVRRTPAAEEKPTGDDVKSDWDASSDDEATKAATADVKDSWDASSDEEEKAPASGKAAKGSSAATKAAPTTKTTPPAKTQPAQAATPAKPAQPKSAPPAKTANGKAASPGESSSEESDSESDGSDDDDADDDSSNDSDSDSSDEGLTKAEQLAAERKAAAAARRAKAHEEALAARSKDDLRSPICVILGHVDTGKTKLLDKIRQTNVQEGEAGGITQQIGATYFPVEAIKTKTAVVNKDGSYEFKVPGLLIIDTPGHESFTNLRSRGSSLCNIAILVVDIMHGLEPQTLESLRLLRDRKTPFIVALNKIDRIYGWTATPDGAFRESLAKQTNLVKREFEDRVQKTILAFAEQGLNSVLYYENKNFARNVSLVPTSAITGEGGDKIVICGLNGPIVTQIRALLTPQPLRELRIKSSYVHHKEVKAALGVKLVAPDLDKAIAGSRLLVVGPDDDEDDLREEVMSDLTSLLNSIDKSGRGVCVQASTLGSLEALLDFLKVSKIPVSGINIGPVHKKDVMRAGTMLEKAKELACILCFDVTVDRDAERMAEEMGIRLFKADIIYHLFDAFTAYNAEIVEAKRRDAAPIAVWPCRLKIIACFCKRDPIILGVDILDGTLRVGTPLCVVKVDPVTGAKEIHELGKITSLEINHRSMEIVKKAQAGAGVAVKIEHAVYQSAKMFGRHFDDKDEIYSRITRQSIDVLKESFKADVSNDEWLLIKALKPRLNVQ